ncbi:MAG: hypothetical protein CME65_03325 [Halobacteriovoraceae bacterium]|nr:hypothetical protein [Halobacteriovoraceae bacterium]|tara:strand:+ start:7447 stop:7971 length:525 start_codon:yes stop_codon:yes gene_type:complete
MIYGLILITFLTIAIIYNKFIKLHQKVKTAWSDIGVYITKRHELIPNLVETVKGYMDHEKKTLESIVEKRAGSIAHDVQLQNKLTHSIKKIFLLAENYPDLKANDSFYQLHLSLIDIEDDVTDARRYFNAVVRDYNNLVESFPTNLIGKIFGFETIEYLETQHSKPIEVNLSES